jgi:hypothetical protein
MMERRVGDVERPLPVDEIRGKSSLRFERLNSKSINNSEGAILGEQILFSGQFKGKRRNCGLIGHKSFHCNDRAINNGVNNGNSSGGNFLYCCKLTSLRWNFS